MTQLIYLFQPDLGRGEKTTQSDYAECVVYELRTDCKYPSKIFARTRNKLGPIKSPYKELTGYRDSNTKRELFINTTDLFLSSTINVQNNICFFA